MPRRRSIQNLKSVKLLKSKPYYLKNKKYHAKHRFGLAYEYKIATHLKALFGERVVHGQWFAYEDDNGPGVCQPDIIIHPEAGSNLAFLIEVKSKANCAAHKQMEKLYLPLVQYVWPEYNVRTIQVCRHMSPEYQGELITDLDELFSPTAKWKVATFSWRC